MLHASYSVHKSKVTVKSLKECMKTNLRQPFLKIYVSCELAFCKTNIMITYRIRHYI